ncbi:MAG: ABC transporter substrate-binding protein [Halioglobus sp.]
MKAAVRFPALLAGVSLMAGLMSGCSEGPWNDPNPPAPSDQITYFSVMSPAPPKHLDPALSYSTDEALFLMQIYEPALGYHFLKRPYELIPQSVEALPEVTYLNSDGVPVDFESGEIAYTRYEMTVKPESHYQPHPAFAVDESGDPLYLFDTAEDGARFHQVPDFPEKGSRPVHAGDFLYAIKRLADPTIGSPMLGLMGQYIVGMKDFSDRIGQEPREKWLDLRQYDMEGLEIIDEQTFRITINGQYPQFRYWLAMHFFSPIAPEVDRFFKNPGFADRNLTLDWWPVGSGPYMMVKNNPNSEIVLEKNPNYRPDFYPSEGEPADAEAGFLDDAGKQVPFIDRAVFRLEKTTLPLWAKFLQGYYDRSGEVHGNTTKVFDEAFTVGPDGLELTKELEGNGITVSQDIKPGMYYYGFNMRDPVLGGYTDERRKLRRALQIAFNLEEYINIFRKGNGIAGMSPIPPGISGYVEGEAGINPYVYDWVDGKAQRKSIEHAKQLMVEAGYPNGRSAKTGEPLKIFIDVQTQAINNTIMNWMSRAFSQIGVQVEYRPADWSRSREKYLTGNTQVFSHGWIADYPDPENFLFLLSSPESPLVCECDGANNANYESPEYDELFEKMRLERPGPERDAIIKRMVELYQEDAVWLYSMFPRDNYLNNAWVFNTKRHGITPGNLKYLRIDPSLRAQRQEQWNQPVTWPLYAGALVLLLLLVPGVVAYRRRLKATATH